jgi:hypothetical protein
MTTDPHIINLGHVTNVQEDLVLASEYYDLKEEYDKLTEMFDNVMGTLNVDYEDMFPEEDDEDGE